MCKFARSCSFARYLLKLSRDRRRSRDAQLGARGLAAMNVNNPAVKRIMGELKELTKGARPNDFFVAAPM